MSQTILITGGTGFAGSHLAQELVTAGDTNVHVTTYSQPDEFMVTLLGRNNIHQIDLTDSQATIKLFQNIQPTQVYHLAAFAVPGESFDKAQQVLTNNSALQLSVLNAVKTVTPVAKVLTIGSAEEYGISLPGEVPVTEQHAFRPVNPYGVSKVTQDLLAYMYGVSHKLNIVRVRPFNHIGERQPAGLAVSSFASQVVKVERGEQSVIKVGNLSAIRDISDVKDVVQAYIVVMNAGEQNQVYNIGSGVGVQMQTVIELLSSLAKVPIEVQKDESRLRPLDIPEVVANNEKIKALGWQPKIKLETTLERILNWYRQQT